MAIELLVEGYTDEIFLKKCLEDLGFSVGAVYGKKGVNYVVSKARGFAVRGEFSPILILADLMDIDAPCVAAAREVLVPNAYRLTLVRLAVRELESWLMASRTELARFLGISVARVPLNPDVVDDPKRELVNLARASGRFRIQNMFVPKPGLSTTVGSGYVDGIAEFVNNYWSIDSAMGNSASFVRFVNRVRSTFSE